MFQLSKRQYKSMCSAIGSKLPFNQFWHSLGTNFPYKFECLMTALQFGCLRQVLAEPAHGPHACLFHLILAKVRSVNFFLHLLMPFKVWNRPESSVSKFSYTKVWVHLFYKFIYRENTKLAKALHLIKYLLLALYVQNDFRKTVNRCGYFRPSRQTPAGINHTYWTMAIRKRSITS